MASIADARTTSHFHRTPSQTAAFQRDLPLWEVADRYGRRPVLLAGLGIYVLSALGAALSPAMEWLIGWRVIQRIAMGAAVMYARALVRDLIDAL